jgi:Fe-S-cluster-containing dehydrogenase component
MDRRTFLKSLGAGVAGAALSSGCGELRAERDENPIGLLIDTTRCIGCHRCVFACSETHGLGEPDIDDWRYRDMSDQQWTIVNRFRTERGDVFVKRQCMHCLEPACASACLTKAMYKTEDGPIIWRESKCMGCRYCMVSCPFDVPKFEYGSPVPKIQKCRLCWEELREGEKPACVEACPRGVMLHGRRDELLDVARRRIADHPDAYVDHIYGEEEVGGTSVLYLAAVPFEMLGFRTDLGDRPYPEYTREFLYAVPFVLTAVPAFLLGLSRAVGRDGAERGEAASSTSEEG